MTKILYPLAPKKLFSIGLLAAGLLAAPLGAGLASAAPGDGPGAAQGRPDRAEMMRRHVERACADAPARLAGWIAFADTKLAIGDAQRAAWTAFARDLRASAEPLQAQCKQMPPPPAEASNARPPKPDALDRLRREEAAASANLDSLKLRRAAVEKLLPQLSAEQRTAFSELPPVPVRLGPPPHMAERGKLMHRTAR